MEIQRNLKNLKIGEKTIILDVLLEKELKIRLYNLGFFKDTPVKCVLKSPFNEPIAYFVKGSIIALRGDIAEKIICR